MKVFRHEANPPILAELDVITEDTGRRYQTPAGVWYPSITTVLSESTKDGIEAWRDRVGVEYADSVKRRAANRGTRFHAFAERYLNNENPDVSSLNFLEREVFLNATHAIDRIDDIILQEAPVYSDHLQMAGRVDCWAKFDGVRSVIDFKTAEREKDRDHIEHYFMQAAAYAIMLEERTRIPTSQLVLIIGTDMGLTQIFKSYRDNHVKGLLYWRQVYKDRHGF